jgi:hypothetical protein
MKMFGLFSQNYLVNKSLPPSSAPPSSAPPASAPPAPGLKQFNMASIMKMQSSGCKSCRG